MWRIDLKKYIPKKFAIYKIYRIKIDCIRAEYLDLFYMDYEKAYRFCCKKNDVPLDFNNPDSLYYYFYVKEENYD